MTRLLINTLATAPSQAKDKVEASFKSNGFIPNLIGVLANAPAALEAYQTLGKINVQSSLTSAEIEAIQITVAKLNGCLFCVAGHTKIAKNKHLFNESILNALRNLKEFDTEDEKLNSLVRFTIAVVANRGAVSDYELKSFFDAGYNDQQAVEVVLGVSLATLCNYTNNLARTPVNEQLQPFV